MKMNKLKIYSPCIFSMFMKQLMMEKRILYFHGTSVCLFVVIDSHSKEM